MGVQSSKFKVQSAWDEGCSKAGRATSSRLAVDSETDIDIDADFPETRN